MLSAVGASTVRDLGNSVIVLMVKPDHIAGSASLMYLKID
jgi:hypothetical protein